MNILIEYYIDHLTDLIEQLIAHNSIPVKRTILMVVIERLIASEPKNGRREGLLQRRDTHHDWNASRDDYGTRE